jgi:signal transduction histidine kinase
MAVSPARDASSRFRRGLPRRTVGLRLALLYGGLFLASTAVLLGVTYVILTNVTLTRTRTWPRAAGPAGFVVAGQHYVSLHDLLLGWVIALVIMAAVSVWLGWIMARRALAPVRVITTATRQISEDNLHLRLALPGPSDELKELGDTIDGLLARLEGAFEAQRIFVANASHELRTPLAMMRTSLDVAAGKSPPVSGDAQVLAGKVREGLDQADRLVESFLVLARAQHGVMSDLTTVSLAEITAGALLTRRATAAGRELTVRQCLGGAEVTGSQTLLARLVANVVDNAVGHNEPGGFIDVATETDGPVARIIVESGGPTLEPEKVAKLAQPFRRLGTDRTTSGPGVGLGLSIVAAIAAAHCGTLDLRARPQGGLRVVIELPHAPAPAAAGDGSRR